MVRKRKTKAEPAPAPSWWDTAPPGIRHGLCAGFLVALALVFYGPALFSGKDLVGGDIRHWSAVAESMLQHRENTDEEPLWATNVFAGMPGYVISPPPRVPQADTAVGWLRLIAWPVSHFIFLLLGTYALVYYLWKNNLAAVLSACAFGLTTYLPIILVAGHNTKFVALCFAPWLLLAFVNVLRKPSLVSSLLFAATLAINLRAGHIQITYYIAFTAFVWWLAEGVAVLRSRDGRAWLHSSGLLFLGAAVGLLMAAELYLPSWEYKAFSIRGGDGGGLGWGYAMSWSQGPAELLTLLIAEAFGGAALYWGPKPPTGGPHYVGGIVLLLSILAVWKVRTTTVRALAIGAALMILFSLGRHLEVLNGVMFRYFPLFDAFRVPETWLIMVAFVLAVLGGAGLTYVLAQARKSQGRHALHRITIGFLIGILVLILGRDVFFSFTRVGEEERVQQLVAAELGRPRLDSEVIQVSEELIEERLKSPREEVFVETGVRTLVVLVFATSLLLLFSGGKVAAWVMQVGLILIVLVDLFGIGRRYFNEDFLSRTGTPVVATHDVDQFIEEEYHREGGAGAFRVLSLEEFDQTRNARPSFHHESLGGYSGAKLQIYQDFLDNLLYSPLTGFPKSKILDMMNVRYVIVPRPFPGMDLAFRGEMSGLLVLENRNHLPRAFVVGEVEVIEDPEQTWERLTEASFDPGRLVFLANSLEAKVVPVDSNSVVSVEPLEYGPRAMVWQVATDAPRLLVVSEVYYPAGWTAWVDGNEVPIHRANYLLRAVTVPEGEHTIELRFNPRSVAAGQLMSRTSTAAVYLGLIAVLAGGWVRRRVRAWAERR